MPSCLQSVSFSATVLVGYPEPSTTAAAEAASPGNKLHALKADGERTQSETYFLPIFSTDHYPLQHLV